MLEDPYEQIQVPGGLNKVIKSQCSYSPIYIFNDQMLVHPNNS